MTTLSRFSTAPPVAALTAANQTATIATNQADDAPMRRTASISPS